MRVRRRAWLSGSAAATTGTRRGEPGVADLFRSWFAAPDGSRRLLAETFICIEPQWALATRTVPFWMPFPVESSAAALARYLAHQPDWDDIAVTLFAHGVRSAGLAPADCWQQLADRAHRGGQLVAVDTKRWPVDFATLARYSDALDRLAPATGPVRRIGLPQLRDLACQVREGHPETPNAPSWEWLR
jgi:hypothetical protein